MKLNCNFDFIRPDEVAECWDGISNNLYKKLWDLVPLYEKINMEDCGPADVIGINSVSSFQDKFSEEEIIELNKLNEIQISLYQDSPERYKERLEDAATDMYDGE